MSHRERSDRKGKDSSGKRGRQQEQDSLVEGLLEEVRTIDSEIDLLKQKMNAIIRQVNILKRVILSEKKEIKDLESKQGLEDEQFKELVEVLKNLKGGG